MHPSRTYRLPALRRAVGYASGVILTLAGVLVLATLIADTAMQPPALYYVVAGTIAFGVVLAGFGIALVALVIKTSITLHPDAIEGQGLFVARRLERAEIGGWYMVPSSRPPVIALVPFDRKKKPLKFPRVLLQDPHVREWMETLPLGRNPEDAA